MPDLEFISYNAGRQWLVGPRSYLVDRSIPACEEILLPEAKTESGYLQFNVTERDELSEPAALGRVHSFLHKVNRLLNLSKTDIISDELVLDFRVNSPSNWAHAFTNHLPLALYIRSILSRNNNEKILIILPQKISKNIVNLFESLGFRVLVSKGDVVGRIITFEMKPWRSIRSLRHEIVNNELASTELYNKVVSVQPVKIDKIFVSRKDARRIINEDEISEHLKSIGYSVVYLEDYTVYEQIALLSYATKIVAIHGAGLGPLLLRKVFNDNVFHLVEIFSPAHMSDCYRVMTHQLGGKWIGVRGRCWEKLIKEAYSGNVNQYSLNDFSVDLESIKTAFKMIDEENR